MTPPFRYRLFGLTITSALELPELDEAPPVATADVAITLDESALVDDLSQEPVPTDGGFVIPIAGVARYLIRGGAEIRVAPDPSAAPANVRLYLLGSAMGMLLHQRGLLPLHANAVEIGGSAVAFVGRSGAGKSTLAAWFHDRGYPVISDDVCVVRLDQSNGPTVTPGLPRLRLWREALERSGRDPCRYSRSYAGDECYDKFDVPTQNRVVASTPTKLAAIYFIEEAEEFAITPIRGAQAVAVLMANTYRGGYLATVGRPEKPFQNCTELARLVPLFTFNRPLGFNSIAQDVSALIEHALCGRSRY